LLFLRCITRSLDIWSKRQWDFHCLLSPLVRDSAWLCNEDKRLTAQESPSSLSSLIIALQPQRMDLTSVPAMLAPCEKHK
jgi:hypothetical protein